MAYGLIRPGLSRPTADRRYDSRGNQGGPKEWGSYEATGLTVFALQFLTCSSPHVDRFPSPLPCDPLTSPRNNVLLVASLNILCGGFVGRYARRLHTRMSSEVEKTPLSPRGLERTCLASGEYSEHCICYWLCYRIACLHFRNPPHALTPPHPPDRRIWRGETAVREQIARLARPLWLSNFGRGEDTFGNPHRARIS